MIFHHSMHFTPSFFFPNFLYTVTKNSPKIVEFIVEKQKFPNFKGKMTKFVGKKTLVLPPLNNNAMSLWCKSLKWFFALLWYIFLDQSLQFSNTLNLPSYNKIVPMHAKDVSNVGQICGLVGRKREF